MSRFIALFILIFAFSFVFYGCGDSDDKLPAGSTVPKVQPNTEIYQTKTEVQPATNEPQQKEKPVVKPLIAEIRSLAHKSKSEVEKLLGKPSVIRPYQSSDHKLEKDNKEKVPAKVGFYLDYTVEITYQNDLAARVWIIPKDSYTYPTDTEKIFNLYGVPLGHSPSFENQFMIIWENTIPNIFSVQFNINNNKINELGIIFSEQDK